MLLEFLLLHVTPSQNSDYKVIGKIIAMSIVQGGPGFPIMLPAAYHYLTTREYIGQVVKDSDVPDPFVLELLTKVSTCNAWWGMCSLY